MQMQHAVKRTKLCRGAPRIGPRDDMRSSMQKQDASVNAAAHQCGPTAQQHALHGHKHSVASMQTRIQVHVNMDGARTETIKGERSTPICTASWEGCCTAEGFGAICCCGLCMRA